MNSGKEDNPELTRVLTLINSVVLTHECRIIDIDLERRIINIEGPEAAKVQCAMAIEKILE